MCTEEIIQLGPWDILLCKIHIALRSKIKQLLVYCADSDSDSMGESKFGLRLYLCGLDRTLTPPRWTWTQAGGLGLWSHGLGLGLHPGGLRLTVSPCESGEKYTNTRHMFKLLCAIIDKTEE